MTDYSTADLHLGHRKVAEIRGFDSVEEHDEVIMGNLRSALKVGDRLWVLGDLTVGRDQAAELDAAWRLATLAVQTHLIAGNHDAAHPMHRHSERAHELLTPYLASIDSMGTFRHRKGKIMLSHFPYAGDRGTDRYPEYRLRDCGIPVIHGHTHAREPISHSPAGTLQICVSLDAWNLKPVAKETLTGIIDIEQEDE